MNCKVTTLQTWLTPLTIVETANGVRYVDFDDGKQQFMREARGELTRIPGLPDSTPEFEAYFHGKLRTFSTPADLVGTPFQVACWKAMQNIPYGQTITYAQQGHIAGTRGYQAVGQANRRNPVPILIPCHRVVSLHGPGGYFGDRLWMKRTLLEFEGALWPTEWGHDLPDFLRIPSHARIDENL